MKGTLPLWECIKDTRELERGYLDGDLTHTHTTHVEREEERKRERERERERETERRTHIHTRISREGDRSLRLPPLCPPPAPVVASPLCASPLCASPLCGVDGDSPPSRGESGTPLAAEPSRSVREPRRSTEPSRESRSAPARSVRVPSACVCSHRRRKDKNRERMS